MIVVLKMGILLFQNFPVTLDRNGRLKPLKRHPIKDFINIHVNIEFLEDV
ncbi:hypothetical protein [Paenisporosarcina antarctica]|nr:hypothetical protein [Paenisporosarcina antarctica]